MQGRGNVPIWALLGFALWSFSCATEAAEQNTRAWQEYFSRFAATSDRLIIIDDDVGMYRERVRKEGNYDVSPWFPFTDPDGGLQVVYTAREPGTQLLGVTCMFGTVSQSLCQEAAVRVLDAMDRTDIPVLAGAAHAHLRGVPTQASRFMCEALRALPHRVEIVASAPLTNISTLLNTCAGAAALWKRLVVMSGEFGMGSDIQKYAALTGGDLNLSSDFPAAEHVFAAGGAFEIFPNEIMDEIHLTPADLETLAAAGTQLGKFVFDETHIWAALNGLGNEFEGFPPHGMTGMAAILNEAYAGAVSAGAAVALSNDGKPIGRHYWGAVATHFTSTGTPHRIVWSLSDPDQVKTEALGRLR